MWYSSIEMRNKTHWLINLACFVVPVIFFHLCLKNVETKTVGVSVSMAVLIPLSLLRQFPVVGLGISAVLIALLASKRVRVPRKLVQAGLSFIMGLVVGLMWFGQH